MLTVLSLLLLVTQVYIVHGAGCITPADNTVINASVTVCPGTYTVIDAEEDGIFQVMASSITITLHNVILVGSPDDNPYNYSGYGFVIKNQNGVTVDATSCSISKMRSAFLVIDGTGHTIKNGNFSHHRIRTQHPNAPGSSSDFLSVWLDWPETLKDDQIGNGIVLVHVNNSHIFNNTMEWQQNGVSMYWCDSLVVQNNTMSNNNGWGMSMLFTNNTKILNNVADNCYPKHSWYCHNVQGDGCDAAALLLIKASNDNLISNNSLQNSGDACFMAGQSPTRHWGCDRNTIIYNNLNYAKAICMECTFARDNVFMYNQASHSNRYGGWYGYTINTTCHGNNISANVDAGISNDSAQNITITDNIINDNPIGINLVYNPVPGNPIFNQVSKNYIIRNNQIKNNKKQGLSLVDTINIEIAENDISGNKGGNIYVATRNQNNSLAPLVAHHNDIQLEGAPYNIMNVQPATFNVSLNWWGTNKTEDISKTITGASTLKDLPSNPLPYLELNFTQSHTTIMLRRVVNERAADATSGEAFIGDTIKGNMHKILYVGSMDSSPLIVGFFFRDVYLPDSSPVTGCQLVLPVIAMRGTVNVKICGSLDANPGPFEDVSTMPANLPVTDTCIAWNIPAPQESNNTKTGSSSGSANYVRTPDLTGIVNEIRKQTAWKNGNAMVFMLIDHGSSSYGELMSFDATGYSPQFPQTLPYVFQRYRQHRFTKFVLQYTDTVTGSMVLERELGSGYDNTDTVDGVDPQNVQTGTQFVDGFRFPNVLLTSAAQSNLQRCYILFPTDGPYHLSLDFKIWAEEGVNPGPYSSSKVMPDSRKRYSNFVYWNVTTPWHFTEWHNSTDLCSLVKDILQETNWKSGNHMAFDMFTVHQESPKATRRVWGFARDPRRTPHDFPHPGLTPFTPILHHSVP